MTYAETKARANGAEADIATLTDLDARTLSRIQRALEAAYRRVDALPPEATPEEAAAVAGTRALVLAGILPSTRGELQAALDEASGRALVALIRRRRDDLRAGE